MLGVMPSDHLRGTACARTPSPTRGLQASPLLAWGLVGLGCRLSPSEAAPVDASAWPDDDAALLGDDEPGAEPGPREVGPPTRPRPPRAIFRDELERATGSGPAYLLRELGPEPFRHQGRFVGWEITQLFPDDPGLCVPGVCDLALGDVILGVNAHRLETPQDLSDAFASLPAWTQLRVQSLRDGQRREVTYAILDDPAGAATEGAIPSPRR
jgi:hypothetical protein